MNKIYTVLLCFWISSTSNAIPRTLLYDYKGGDVSQLPRADDVSSPPIQLKVPVVLYGVPYESIYVSRETLIAKRVLAQNFSLIIAEAIWSDYVKGRSVTILNNDSFKYEGYCSLCKHICTEALVTKPNLFSKFYCKIYSVLSSRRRVKNIFTVIIFLSCIANIVQAPGNVHF